MDIAPVYGSPWLIAVNRVLLRLLVPRHSPCALISLTFVSDPFWDWVFIHSLKIVVLPYFFLYDYFWRNPVKVISLCLALHFIQFSRYDCRIKSGSQQSLTAQICTLSLFLQTNQFISQKWWAQVDSNHRFFAYVKAPLWRKPFFLAWPFSFHKNGGLKWTRTTDLTLIRRAL